MKSVTMIGSAILVIGVIISTTECAPQGQGDCERGSEALQQLSARHEEWFPSVVYPSDVGLDEIVTHFYGAPINQLPRDIFCLYNGVTLETLPDRLYSTDDLYIMFKVLYSRIEAGISLLNKLDDYAPDPVWQETLGVLIREIHNSGLFGLDPQGAMLMIRSVNWDGAVTSDDLSPQLSSESLRTQAHKLAEHLRTAWNLAVETLPGGEEELNRQLIKWTGYDFEHYMEDEVPNRQEMMIRLMMRILYAARNGGERELYELFWEQDKVLRQVITSGYPEFSRYLKELLKETELEIQWEDAANDNLSGSDTKILHLVYHILQSMYSMGLLDLS